MVSACAPSGSGSKSRARRRPGRFATGAVVALTALSLHTPVAWAQDDDQPASIIRDTEIEEILHQDTDPVFQAAGLDPKSVKMLIIGTKEINAETTTGPTILIYTGLIMETKTPNQLIGVLAHETGHAAGGHIARSDEGIKNALRTFLLTMGLGLAAAAAGRPDAGAALMYSADYFATLNYLGYSRVQEADADQAAATYLEHAGMSGKGLVDFFDTFRYEEVFDHAHQYPFFQSHPLTSDRIEALRVRVEKMPHYNTPDTPEAIERHKIMVAKLKGFMNPPYQTLAEFKETDTSFPARYARAIAWYKAGEMERSLKDIDALIAANPNNPYLYELRGQVLFDNGKIKESEAPYRKAVELKPNAPLLRILLGETLASEEDKSKLDDAIAQLKRALDFENDNPDAWQFLARAYDAKGDPGMARLATAEQDFALGQLKDARVFAMRAREMLPKDTPQWRRATDIVLVSKPSRDDLKAIGQGG
jgi:predicted Zn-dependent protease